MSDSDPVTILAGDAIDRMREIPDRTAQTCVTSPPYYGLRDYDIEPTSWPEVEFAMFGGMPPMVVPAMDCCLGLEPTPVAFVGHIVQVFREVHRVLRDDGTLWLNLGDSYAGSWGAEGRTTSHGNSAYNKNRLDRHWVTKHPKQSRRRPAASSLIKPKDMYGIPWMVAFALRADGWYLRQDIIWSKPNPMPEPAKDRCAKSHEYVFLLAKSTKYFFNANAIREPAVGDEVANGFRGGAYVNGNTFDNAAGGKRTVRGNKRVSRYSSVGTTNGSISDHDGEAQHGEGCEDIDYAGTRNKRSVWNISARPFPGAHFATFPQTLVEPCILAGSRPGDAVLDPFTGSGTTGLVARRLRRTFIGCEANPGNVAMADARIRSGGVAYGQEVAVDDRQVDLFGEAS